MLDLQTDTPHTCFFSCTLHMCAVVLTLGGDDIVEVDVPDREQADFEREKVEVRDKEKRDKSRTSNARSNM